MRYLLECCVDSVESAMAAERGGADRLELCQGLMIGGTTPSLGLYRQVRARVRLPIHILIRPRAGDFLYSPCELAVMKEDIQLFTREGADGIVIGCLDREGDLDLESMQTLCRASDRPSDTAKPRASITLHRAFDMCRDPFRSMEECILLGIDTILTSGQKDTALQGADLLRELFDRSEGRIELMAGAGIDAAAISKLLEMVPLGTFHMSGKEILESRMLFRQTDVHMGAAGFSEYEIWRTDEKKIKEAACLLHGQSR